MSSIGVRNQKPVENFQHETIQTPLALYSRRQLWLGSMQCASKHALILITKRGIKLQSKNKRKKNNVVILQVKECQRENGHRKSMFRLLLCDSDSTTIMILKKNDQTKFFFLKIMVKGSQTGFWTHPNACEFDTIYVCETCHIKI